MDSFVAILQWTALVVAVLIALSSLDDLFVDAVFWAMKLKRRIFGQSGPGAVAAELLVDKPEQPIAIMLPAWKEFDVIASMVESAVNTLAYRNYTIFIGTYANDSETIAEAEKVARRYKQVRHVRVPHDGPTCKADCLNHIVSDILYLEEEVGEPFAGLVLHDSEDVLHPLELHLFNYLLPAKDMIQLPVVSLEQRYRDLVAGTYMDEFAEWHAKDLVVRQRLAKTVPSAGVGTCFSRRAIKALMEDGDPFNTATLTEDYDIGNRLGLEPEVGRSQWTYAHYYGDLSYLIENDVAFGIAEGRVGRSFALGDRSNVITPYLVVRADLDTGRQEEGAFGAGAGLAMRHWFDESDTVAWRGFIDFDVQARQRIVGDRRATGVLATITVGR